MGLLPASATPCTGPGPLLFTAHSAQSWPLSKWGLDFIAAPKMCFQEHNPNSPRFVTLPPPFSTRRWKKTTHLIVSKIIYIFFSKYIVKGGGLIKGYFSQLVVSNYISYSLALPLTRVQA